jgi:Uma2 family endonuclease
MSTTAPMTAEEFLALPDIEDQRVELIDGDVIDMPSGGPAHERTKANLIRILSLWLDRYGAGLVYSESAYRLDRRIVLVPDLSVLGAERLSQRIEEQLRGAPDLAIEIVSSETADRLHNKVRMYFKYGSRGVWSIFPGSRTIQINHPNGRADTLEQDRILEDPDTLPGFSTLVGAIFEGL